jgi:hypothetical protein
MNGAVPCFRDLSKKPSTCAPHELHAMNCVSYDNWSDLERKISRIDDSIYENLQFESMAWVRNHTTTAEAKRLLDNRPSD